MGFEYKKHSLIDTWRDTVAGAWINLTLSWDNRIKKISGTDMEWHCVVISLTGIVITLSLKIIKVGFLVLLLSSMSSLFFVTNIIIIIKIDVIYHYQYYHYYCYYYHLLLLSLFFFRTYPNALYCFLVKSRVVRLATTIDVQAKLLIRLNWSAHIVSYQVATTIAVHMCLSRSLLTLCITVI